MRAGPATQMVVPMLVRTARALLAMSEFWDTPTRLWRHHGLGMLQSELDEQLRVHVWHPRLRTFAFDDFRDVHDHRFDLTSLVVVGRIDDVHYRVREVDGRYYSDREPNTRMWAIVHAKAQDRTPQIATDLGAVHATQSACFTVGDGDWYRVPRREFHTTRVDDLAVTLVHRTHFDHEPARILGPRGDSGIIGPKGSGVSSERHTAFGDESSADTDWAPIIMQTLREAALACGASLGR
jgi:hypothetical protein